MSVAAKIGHWGGEGGYPQDAQRFPHRLIRVLIHTTGGEISAISFDYVDNNGVERREGPWGTADGQPQVLELATSEYINGIFGTFGTYANTPARIVVSLKFVTNQGKSYEYGRVDSRGTRFDIPVQQGQIVGFFGRSGGRLDAIGIYVRG